jgi:TRAP-type C4-dicarboxylate transport system permease small subunit
VLKLVSWLNRVEAALASLAYLIVTGLLIASMASREFFSKSLGSAETLAVFAAVYASFFGMVLATSANGHLRPQFTDNWLPAAWHPKVARLGDAVSAVLFFGIGVVALLYLSDTFANQDLAPIIYWPLWTIQIVIPYAFFSCGFRHLVFAFHPHAKPEPAVSE